MKKKICYLLVMMMAISLCFGCSKSKTENEVETTLLTEETAESSTEEISESESTIANELTTVKETSSEEQSTTVESTTAEITTTAKPTTTVKETTTKKTTTTKPTTTKSTTTKKQEVTTKMQETTTQKLEPTIVVSSNNITITDDQPVAITIAYKDFLGSYNAYFESSNSSLVTCEWGEWFDGNKITLYIYGQSNGSATITVYSQTYGMDYANATINITVNKITPASQSSIIIDSIGGEYKQWGSSYIAYNLYKLNDATTEIKSRTDGNINIYVTITTSCIEKNLRNYSHISYDYKLYNSSGIVVKTGDVLIFNNDIFELYQDKLQFLNLEPDNYTLVFTDSHLD